MTPDDYCADRVGGFGTHLYYSLLFAPPSARRAAYSIYAYADELAEVADECRDPEVARVKLEWWREELERLYAGAPRHPVTRALAPAVTAHAFERERLFALVDVRQRALRSPVRFEDADSLQAHCFRIGATPALLAATALGIADPRTRSYAEALGAALEFAGVLCRLGWDARRDRIYLPAEALRRFGVAETDILKLRQTPAFAELMAFEIDLALQGINRALAQLAATDRRRQLPGLILAAIACAQLNEIRRDGYRVLERRLLLTPLRKFWAAWSTRARIRWQLHGR